MMDDEKLRDIVDLLVDRCNEDHNAQLASNRKASYGEDKRVHLSRHELDGTTVWWLQAQNHHGERFNIRWDNRRVVVWERYDRVAIRGEERDFVEARLRGVI